jgi:replication factor C small subunit
LNELQRYSATGKIDSGILVSFSDESFKTLIQSMRAKNFTDVRRWVGEHSDIDQTTMFRKFYDYASDFATTNSIPQLVLILADYQYKAAFVADHEINMAACFTEIMVEIEFK